MSSTNFDKFQEILKRPQQSSTAGSASEEQQQQQPLTSTVEGRDSDFESESHSVLSDCTSNRNQYEPRVLRLTANLTRPLDSDVSSPDLVPTVDWKLFAQSWTRWEPLENDSKTLLPTMEDFPPYNMRLMDDLSTSPTSVPHRGPPDSPGLFLPPSRIREHIIHEILWFPSGSKTVQRLRMSRRSPVSWFFWSKHHMQGLDLLREGRDSSFVDIPESHFPALFSMNDSLHRHIVELEKGTNELEQPHIDVFKAFLALITDLFSNARLEQSHMRKSGQVSFDFLWTLFLRDQIVYEKRPVPFCDESYEQCLKVVSIKKARSPLEGVPTWDLILQEVFCRPGFGPCLVTTRRDIRSFTGVRPLTDECIGLVPLDMIPWKERKALISRLSDIGRRYISICFQPWTVWEYEGPVLLNAHSNSTRHLQEAFTISPDNKNWRTQSGLQNKRVKRYTRERVVVDVLNSQAFHRNKSDLNGRVDGLPGHEPSQSEPLTLGIDGTLEDTQHQAARTEELYLVCRNHVPAFLLSSGIEAKGILVSLLRAPVWGETRKAPALPHRTMIHRDFNLWRSVVGNFMSPENARQSKSDGRSFRFPGLMMLFQGPRRMTREMTSEIAEDLQKSLVMIQALDSHNNINVALQKVFRWGGILLVEGPRAFYGTTYEQLTTHPGVIFLASDQPDEVPETCFPAIDAVINCNTMAVDNQGDEHFSCSLWYQYLVDQLPELVATTPGERLKKFADVLASIEPRETRMAKALLTAKRLAQSRGEATKEGHVFQVLRESISPKDMGKFESELEKMEQLTLVADGQDRSCT